MNNKSISLSGVRNITHRTLSKIYKIRMNIRETVAENLELDRVYPLDVIRMEIMLKDGSNTFT